MALVFCAVVVAGLVYALTRPQTYEYVTLYQVAQKAEITDDGVSGQEPVQAPDGVVAKVKNLYLGPVTRELLQEHKAGLPFSVTPSSVPDTELVKLVSQATKDNSALVEKAHEMVAERILDEQNKGVERRQNSQEDTLASTREAIDTLKDAKGSDANSNANEVIAAYTKQLTGIQQKLDQLQKGELAQVAVQSLKTVGTSRTLIMALTLLLGGMLAVMAAFFAAFVGSVRTYLREQ